MNFLVSTTWDSGTPFDPTRAFVTCTLRRTRITTTTRNSELMLRVDRVLELGTMQLDSDELQGLLARVRSALSGARAAATDPTAGQMETAYWTYRVARLQQCRRLLEARVGIRL